MNDYQNMVCWEENNSTMKIANKFDPRASCILFQGDCIELLARIPNEFVTLVITSPPYNLGKEYENKLKLDEYISQQKKVIAESTRILTKNGNICWQLGNYVGNSEIIPLDVILFPIFKELGLKLRNRIIWHFGHGLHASKRFSGRYEVILWFTKSDKFVFNLDTVRIPQKYPFKKYFKGLRKGQLSGNPLGKNPGDVWEIPNVKANHIEKTIHPCQFPVELIERFILSLSNEKDWVFDPFMGVGTSAIAALLHNRRAIGAEIRPDYVKIARERLQKAEKGNLFIRPMERTVYDPAAPQQRISPKRIQFGAKPQQLELIPNKDVTLIQEEKK